MAAIQDDWHIHIEDSSKLSGVWFSFQVFILNDRALAALIFYYYCFLFDSLKSLSTLLANQKRLNLKRHVYLLMGLECGGSSDFSRMFCKPL